MTEPFTKLPPWPYDMRVGGVGIMLRPGQDGQLVGVRSRQVGAVAPSSYAQGSQNPYVEVPYALGRLGGGMGQAVQGGGGQDRYKAANGIDCSVGGIRRLAPFFTNETFPGLPAGTSPDQNAVRQFVVGPGPSQPVLFALVRDHVYWRDPNTPVWNLSKNFGTADSPMQAIWYAPRSGSQGLFVATALGELWRYDGVTWTQATLGVDSGGVIRYAERVEVVGDQMYIASGDLLFNTLPGTDPMLAASWGGNIRVGDHRTRASGLRAVGGVLFVFKWDNVHSLNADGSVNDLFPEMRARQAVSLGRTVAVWEDRLWFGVGPAYYRMDSSAALEPIGPERVIDHGAGVVGAVVSTAGHNDWFNYAVAYDPAANASRLLKFGTWTNPGDASGYRFADAWHGALAVWAGKKVTRCDVIAFDQELNPGTPGPMLWVGFADGTVAWATLPSTSPDPTADPACRFVSSGTLDWPDHDAGAPADFKHWRKAAAAGPLLDATHAVRVALAVDADAAYTDTGAVLDTPGELAVPVDPPRVGKVVRVRETLVGTATVSPEVSEVVLYEQIRPERLELEYQATAQVGNRVARRDGALERRSAQQLRAAMLATAGPGPTSVVMPGGERLDVDVVAVGEAIANPNNRWGVEWDVPLTLVQWRPTP